MGKPSQCKGRGGEREARDILNAAGFSARCHGQWEPLDVSCDFGDGKEVPGEIKRKKDGMGPAYAALTPPGEAKFFMHRSDRKEWLITFTLKEFIYRYGPLLGAPVEGEGDAYLESESSPSQYIPNGEEE
jgi:hypothetical protein